MIEGLSKLLILAAGTVSLLILVAWTVGLWETKPEHVDESIITSIVGVLLWLSSEIAWRKSRHEL